LVSRVIRASRDQVWGVLADLESWPSWSEEARPSRIISHGIVRREVPIDLAVNKVDLKSEALVLYDEYRVRQFAAEVGARWCMTSARTGLNVAPLFGRLVADIVLGVRG